MMGEGNDKPMMKVFEAMEGEYIYIYIDVCVYLGTEAQWDFIFIFLN
jgi:hypothetical protein